MHIMNVHTYVCLLDSLSFFVFVCAFVWAVLWLGLSAVLSGAVGAPWDVALGFSVLPCYAMAFNDNMVAQAVAAPLRTRGVEVG